MIFSKTAIKKTLLRICILHETMKELARSEKKSFAHLGVLKSQNCAKSHHTQMVTAIQMANCRFSYLSLMVLSKLRKYSNQSRGCFDFFSYLITSANTALEIIH